MLNSSLLVMQRLDASAVYGLQCVPLHVADAGSSRLVVRVLYRLRSNIQLGVSQRLNTAASLLLS